ncbi:MAG TPA: cell division protein FtsN [Idiomarina baltica]|uniref:Cell division protein FtsN n=1 Tax=Idiomarina baltica TaxID=190892 RepID=A0A348WP06_9GAMM|nr:SPOR domain-containing protein [Idiomarina sp.]HAR56268.1 cell division protein FtsN [Idiomarina baltica]|tara:strand:+ start:1859 stop:2422 length:564 start_codon:yes stop_codon:yes gene_type:complete
MDYANRKPKPKKKSGKSSGQRGKPSARGAAAKQPKQVPWVAIVLVLALMAAFIYGLLSINGDGDKLPAKPTDQQAADELPPKPKEKWQYIQELESKQVEVDVPERELGPPKLMQCGSFRKQSDAERLRAEIAMAGLESQVRSSEGKNGLWYRVILGPYETKRAAERERHKLQRAKIYGCAIWNWNLD